ncbi:hypothetical protein AC249_AIPGENE6093 [Exaiptasia diaphana]|nr:hypothetical protein AC249_AIPGENE6093 [Exaiptasia diaphana]
MIYILCALFEDVGQSYGGAVNPNMIFRVFSQNLDPRKKWYVLNSDICGITPKKFSSSDFFGRFNEEITSRPISELQDEHGNNISAKLVEAGSRIQSTDLLLGTTFAILAGNIRKRHLDDSKFAKTCQFEALKDKINQLDITTESSDPSLDDLSITRPPISTSTPVSSKRDDEQSSVNRKRKSPPIFGALSNDDSSSSSSSIEDIESRNYGKIYKVRILRKKCNMILEKIHSICKDHNEELASVIARSCLFERGELRDKGQEIIQDVFTKVEKELGLEKTFDDLIPSELLSKRVASMTVPDWQLLLMKLEIPISDEGWQTLLNRTQIGKGGKLSKAPILLSKNKVKALKSLVFNKVENLFSIRPIPEEIDIPGYLVSLESVLCWQIRELRKNLKSIISNLNSEKASIKKNGITVDGQKYFVDFKVTLDLKALYNLLVKDDDEEFQLGGKGLAVEFCFFCMAIRCCSCDLAPHSVCLEHLSSTKANIGGFKGIRDDLVLLLEEELSSVNLCALHCELRNTEQLIASLGLYSHKIGTLKKCNEILSQYGPETTGDRISVKLREGQKTALTKNNIKVKSFSEVLHKVQQLHKTWLDKLNELKARLSEFSVLFAINKVNTKKSTKPKTKISKTDLEESLSDYAAEINYGFFVKVYTGWRDIAKIMRSSTFDKDEQHKIDLYDLQCKEWGFLLREVFGMLLGTGDYGHMTIEHTSMLFRVFGSLREYSNQSIESSHSLQRQLYSKATSHDRHGYGSSIRQLVVHFYSERMLFLRLMFRKALECYKKGKVFHFPGCGWSTIVADEVKWSESDIVWIEQMDGLLTKMFGDDYLEYECDKVTKTIDVAPSSFPDYVYCHELWEDTKPSTDPGHDPECTDQSQSDSPAGNLKENDDNQKSPSGSQPASPVVKNINNSSSQSPSKSKPLISQIPVKVNLPSTPKILNVQTTETYPDLRKCNNHNLTRRQLSDMKLPPVVNLSHADLEVVNSPLRISNPLLIGVRPSSSIVKICKEMLSTPTNHVQIYDDDSDSGEDCDDAVQLGGLGTFNRQALNIWERASEVSAVSVRVKEELKWLSDSKTILTNDRIKSMEKELLDARPVEKIISAGEIIVDVNDLTTLVDERYLTGFVIDAACLKYKALSAKGAYTAYLPTFFQEWSKSQDSKFLEDKVSKYVDKSNINDVSWILTPQHVSGVHWGLIAINVNTSKIFYDDGLHWKPPTGMLPSVKKLLKCLYSISGHANQFNPKTWKILSPAQRFGMPRQPKGSGSCGMGVILSFKDIMNGPIDSIPRFDWSFNEMHKHRLKVMDDFITWKYQ